MRLRYSIVGDAGEHSCAAEVIRIGRNLPAEIVFAEEFVSRSHARIHESAGRVLVEDAGSDNGTFVNGRRITAAVELREGDRVRFGDPGPEIRVEGMSITPVPANVPPAMAMPLVPSKGNGPLNSRPPVAGGPLVKQAGNAETRDGRDSDRLIDVGNRRRNGRNPYAGVAVLGIGVLVAAILAVDWCQTPPSWTSLYQRIDPATVKIHTTMPNGEGGSGSGFVVDRRGWIVTSFHVVANSDAVEVELHDGRRVRAEKVVALAIDSDLAILLITPPGRIAALPLRPDDALPPAGTEVCVVGYAGGLTKSRTTGTISSHLSGRKFRKLLEERKAELEPLVRLRIRDNTTWLQTDAAVSKGNSGGPVVDRFGRVLGVATWGITGPGIENMNFACAAKHVARLIADWDGEYLPLSDLKMAANQ